MKNMRYIFSVLLVVCLLFSTTPVGDGFITFWPGGLEGNLIVKVHKPQWKIVYLYGIDCKIEEKQNDEALKEAISASLRAWLQPLKELNPDRPIVDKFVYEKLPDYDPNVLAPKETREKVLASDLYVASECMQRRSFARIGMKPPPGVVIQRMDYTGEITNSFLGTLTHELGHAFGLADTYTYERHDILQTQGGLQWTSGNQPASVMAMGSGFHRTKPLAIGEDDKRGIVWLYKYVYEDLATDDCFFADYVSEVYAVYAMSEISGCIPKYPLIFETKHNPPGHALQLLKDDPTIDINTQDESGMTALHYAVMYEKEEVVKALLDHPDIKPSLKNKQGKTPLDIALATNNTAIIEMFPEPPPRKEDVNRDGVVNILDLVAVASKFGEKDAGNADVNGDGVVDIRDLVLVAGAFGTTASAPASL